MRIARRSPRPPARAIAQWRAYLSTAQAVNAKDRIGAGPWFNAKGVQVAANVADLHSDNNKLSKENSLTEKGAVVNGRGDTPNQHDILTGSNLDGTTSASDRATTGRARGDDGDRDRRSPRSAGRRDEPDLVALGARVEGLQHRRSCAARAAKATSTASRPSSRNEKG